MGPYCSNIAPKTKALPIEKEFESGPLAIMQEVYYKGEKIHGQVLDMVVEGKVILELKSVETLLPIHEAQILSYLKSTGLPAGLLINFKERFVKNGVKRFVQSKPI